jgi:TPR repeat protein
MLVSLLCRDGKAAHKWLHAAAAGKLPAAQLLLGLAYKAGGWGCEPSPLKAVSNIEKAAHQGLAEAQLEAALCHM